MAMKREAIELTGLLKGSQEEVSEAKHALEVVRATSLTDLAGARAATAAVEREMAVALAREAEVTSGLKLKLSRQLEEMEVLREALLCTEGSLKASKLDLCILERKHSRAVESMVEYRCEGLAIS